MKIHELIPKKSKNRKRIGRGNGSGRGTFSGRGCKGQNSRAGGGVRIGFEGGQSGILAHMPKLRGFKSPNKITFTPISLATLNSNFETNTKIDTNTLIEKKLIHKNEFPKILAKGDLSKKLEITGITFSDAAKKKIEKAGGSIK